MHTIQYVVLAGPELGGTKISVRGRYLAGSICSFGRLHSAATMVTSELIQCISPPAAAGHAALSIGDHRHSFQESMITFTYRTLPAIFRLQPASGPIFGGQSVTVVHTHTSLKNIEAQGRTCRFGHNVVTASVLNVTAMRCISPALQSGSVSVHISTNAQDFSTSMLRFEVFGMQVLRFEPSSGSTQGSTVVQLWVIGLPNCAWPIQCIFGSTARSATCIGAHLPRANAEDTAPQARIISCATPPHPQGVVSFGLLAQDLSNTSVGGFTFNALPEIHNFTPQVSIDGAHMPVVVRGAHFTNSSHLCCRFGMITLGAAFVDTTTLVCIAPPFTQMQHVAYLPENYSRSQLSFARISLQVSVNNADFSLPVSFHYSMCPMGHYCLDNVATPCPPGAACVGFGSNFTLCPPGTYQPASGATRCLLCQRGTYCPSHGMAAPLICPPGMVCGQSGLPFPNQMCPFGHFCLPGTETLNPFDPATARRPIECPENSWCSLGVASNISIPGNASTPQPCLIGFVCYRGSQTAQGSGPCPQGFFCPPGSLPRRCPPANYCPGVANVFPSLCSPGFYNDGFAGSKCIECPIGHICPEYGLEHPVTCPAGSVCSVPGRQTPANLCPAGYFCLDGTETEDVNSESEFRPRACPEATYCQGGIKTNVTNELDFNAPQPCPQVNRAAVPYMRTSLPCFALWPS